jgi:hypothetical protein
MFSSRLRKFNRTSPPAVYRNASVEAKYKSSSFNSAEVFCFVEIFRLRLANDRKALRSLILLVARLTSSAA